MKKKIVSVAIAFFLVVGLGNVVLAHSTEGDWSFENMLPHMKQMHPEMGEQDLEQMYQNCHGSDSGNEKESMNNQL